MQCEADSIFYLSAVDKFVFGEKSQAQYCKEQNNEDENQNRRDLFSFFLLKE